MMMINADDFGMDAATNQAIVEAFKLGWCNSATLMATAPGFDDACRLIRENNLEKNIGLHLVLREGAPLTEDIKKFPVFCNQQRQLAFSRANMHWYFSAKERAALAQEIRAQINKCRQQGISLTHVDSHQHTHNDWAVAGVLIKVAKEEKIAHIRLASNANKKIPWFKKIYKYVFNVRLKAHGLAGTDYFGSAQDFSDFQNPAASFEIMVHPKFNVQGILIDNTQ